MILSQTAIYALRAAAILASVPQGETLRAVELAERTGVPVHSLGKVMRRLVVAGVVQSRKGHGGGFALSREPASITFADIFVATGDVPDPGQCAFSWGGCDPREPCLLHESWSGLQQAVDGWAGRATLADTVP